jgi:hypothetical protein
MARGKFFKPAIAGEILAYAAMHSDKEATSKFGVSQMSLCRWRKRMTWDPELFSYVASKINSQPPAWVAELPDSMRRFIAMLDRFMAQKVLTPEDLRAAGEQFERLARIQIALRIVDERFAVGTGREGLEEVGSLPAGRRIDPPFADPEPTDSE